MPSGQTLPTVDNTSLTKSLPTQTTLRSLQSCVNTMEQRFSNNCDCLSNPNCCQTCQGSACQSCQSAGCQSCQGCQYCQGCQSCQVQCQQCW